jgi:uncharacterized sporulation protein YeaH/YhbH (DUF444 family)
VVRQAVRESSEQRGIKELDQGGEVSIPADSIREPRFQRQRAGGQRQAGAPGQQEVRPGGHPAEGGRGRRGSGSEGSPNGEGEDAFSFVLSQDEYLDLFFEDLELPNMAKRALAVAESFSLQRAGYSVSGSPANLALGRTMRNSLSRRNALRRPKREEIDRLSARSSASARPASRRKRSRTLRAELRGAPEPEPARSFIDPIDVRYRRFQPCAEAGLAGVMFCLMDTSASMTEHMKDLAKRFFALLYLFLKRRYQHVDVVFIRHTHLAEEVDEDTFFHSRETGGTVVSSALEKMHEIARQRYRLEDWNIYGAQASDGDNSSGDSERTLAFLQDSVLPLCQYFAYLEVGRDPQERSLGFLSGATELWRTYEKAGIAASASRCAR